MFLSYRDYIADVQPWFLVQSAKQVLRCRCPTLTPSHVEVSTHLSACGSMPPQCYGADHHTAAQAAFILGDQHQFLHNTLRIRPGCVTVGRTNLLPPSVVSSCDTRNPGDGRHSMCMTSHHRTGACRPKGPFHLLVCTKRFERWDAYWRKVNDLCLCVMERSNAPVLEMLHWFKKGCLWVSAMFYHEKKSHSN